jgi:hypothetical protein
MIFLTPEEWRSLRDKMIKASPKTLLVLAVLVIGYWAGWYMKGNDIAQDCKYASSFRVETSAFNCTRKI